MTDIIEQLRDGYAGHRPFPFDRVDRGTVVAPIYAIHDYDLRALLAALEAQDKELAALREQYSDLLTERHIIYTNGKMWKARAETAERELTRERDAFQRHVQTLNDNGISSHSEAVALVATLRRERDEARAALSELTDYIKSWTSPAEMRQRAGEMTAQEVRTVQAILSAILDKARAARAVMEKE